MLEDTVNSEASCAWRTPIQWLAFVGLVVVAKIVTIMLVVSLANLVPHNRAALPLSNAIPRGEEFAYLDRVSHWPADWLAAVCRGPVYTVRRSLERLPHASDVATCKALAEPNGGNDDLLVAHFQAELPMQVDLHDGGYTWYAFAWDRGRMATFASRSEAEVSDPITNLGETPALEPLRRFGFTIYSDPGP